MVIQLVEKQRLIEFAEALRSRLNYFDELENVRFGNHTWHHTNNFLFYFIKTSETVNTCSMASAAHTKVVC
jgi:hypothetical protein